MKHRLDYVRVERNRKTPRILQPVTDHLNTNNHSSSNKPGNIALLVAIQKPQRQLSMSKDTLKRQYEKRRKKWDLSDNLLKTFHAPNVPVIVGHIIIVSVSIMHRVKQTESALASLIIGIRVKQHFLDDVVQNRYINIHENGTFSVKTMKYQIFNNMNHGKK